MIRHELARMVLGLIPFVGRGTATTREIKLRLECEGFEYDIRTIQNYVNELSDAGDIIEVGREGRARLFARVRLKKEAMCPELAVALHRCKQHICAQLPSELVSQLNEQFDEAAKMVESLQSKAPQNQLVQFTRHTQQVSSERLAAISQQKPAIIQPVLDALYNREPVDLAVAGYTSSLTLTPVSLYEEAGGLYLKALPEGFNCKSVTLDINHIFSARYPAEAASYSPRRAA